MNHSTSLSGRSVAAAFIIAKRYRCLYSISGAMPWPHLGYFSFADK
jgi:hypothetical protein